MAQRKGETIAEYRARRAAEERRRRADPDAGGRIRAQARRRYANGGRERQRDYYARLRTQRFFHWRARLWSSRWQVTVTEAQLLALWRAQDGRCALSGRPLEADAHLDHVVPVAAGGAHTVDNLRWLDPEVNVARQALGDEAFARLCADVVAAQAPVMTWITGRVLQALEAAG